MTRHHRPAPGGDSISGNNITNGRDGVHAGMPADGNRSGCHARGDELVLFSQRDGLAMEIYWLIECSKRLTVTVC